MLLCASSHPSWFSLVSIKHLKDSRNVLSLIEGAFGSQCSSITVSFHTAKIVQDSINLDGFGLVLDDDRVLQHVNLILVNCRGARTIKHLK